MIGTERLILRRWQESDKLPFAAMSADAEAMRYLGGVWDKATSEGFITRAEQHFDAHGYGIYALELKETQSFIGFAGLRQVGFQASFTPAVDIGWRLGRDYWGKGFAIESARKLLTHAFSALMLPEVVTYCTPVNRNSVKVMEKLGMQRDVSFQHPHMSPDDPMAEMVLYRMKKDR